jgi:hypothetical protein
MARGVSNPQEWAQQHPHLAAELREIGEPVDALSEAVEANRADLVEMGCGTAGWLTIAVVLVGGVEHDGWSPWWLGGVVLALLIAIAGLIQVIGLLGERRQIRRDIPAPPAAGGDQ